MSRLQGSKIGQSFSVLIFVLLIIAPVQAQYSGGTGEPNNPYQIATAEDLIALGNEPNDYDKHFIMTADIDLAGYIFEEIVIAKMGIPFKDPPFSGIFNGNFYTISNLNIQGLQYSGLFGVIDEGEVRNLGIIDVNISSDGNAGALTSVNKGSILNCYSTGLIAGDEIVGGLVGKNETSSVIKMCYSTCNITGTSTRGTLGGLVGNNAGIISDSYSKGDVFGSHYKGGLAGISVTGSINRCYATGKIPAEGNFSYLYVGGLVGGLKDIDVNNVSNSFWDIETSGLTISAGGISATTIQMKDPNTFKAVGWDFIGKTDGPSDIWAIPENGGYPILWWQLEQLDPLPIFSGGSGTEDDPFLIATINDLNDIGSNPRLIDKHFKLIQDINLENKQFHIISEMYYPFDGVFDGNRHKIFNFVLTSHGTNGIGFFGHVGNNGLIKNIGIENVDINAGTGEYVGGLAGLNRGTIINSYTTGNILGRGNLGGLVGSNSGNIQDCFSHSNVAGALSKSNPKGGIAGRIEPRGLISKCYSTGQISGYQSGGLVGVKDRINPIASFWDIETSGKTSSAGGFGKTTADMQMENTFTNAGWDFVGETANGTEDIWTICEGTNYPRFVWQIREGDLVCPDGIAMEDFDFFMDHWDDTNCDSYNNYCEGTDLDFSGTVDISDFLILLDNWLDENP